MQLPDNIRKLVAFLAYNTKDGSQKLAGTAFFIGMPVANVTGKSGLYLVTARHCIESIDRASIDGKVLIRLNLRAGGVGLVESRISDWQFPDDERVDVAACIIGGKSFDAQIEFGVLSVVSLASAEYVAREGIGIGDEVFAVGLFTQHYGHSRNTPIIRIGNIAAMPEEPVRTKRGSMEAFLIECRSIGGLSGCPVFVNPGNPRVLPDGDTHYRTGITFALLGVMHGHWDFPLEADAPMYAQDGTFESEKLNMGIGVVVPSQRIIDLLACDKFVKHREQLSAKWAKAELPTED